ncbi:MAG: imidazole glycerol phosphate synthase subunit HisH [Candidatus Aegiribacteria sp.]|nr:imidazole glycerol phosphate synthase subunit HisH [Candidatus Aegiribacteria sp.]
MVVIINYGMGNLGSIQNMLKHVGVESTISDNITDIENADKLVLSGVGAFDSGMKNISDLGFISVLNSKVLDDKTPILGICLGMQLFAQSSEEGKLSGLGWINADTVRFSFADESCNLKIPHMGWNHANVQRDSELIKDVSEDSRFYFVHSYHLDCRELENVICTTHYGYDFPSVVEKENIFGVQFHPEKSHKFGMKLLSNFAQIV